MFVVLTRRESVFLPLKAMFTPVCLNRLVTFLMFGDMKVKVAHFLFFLGCVGWGGGAWVLFCAMRCLRLWIRAVGKFMAMCRIVCHSFSRRVCVEVG